MADSCDVSSRTRTPASWTAGTSRPSTTRSVRATSATRPGDGSEPSGQDLQYLVVVLRETTELELGEHESFVLDDFERPPSARHELDVLALGRLDLRSQTGRAGLVPSSLAVFDADAHDEILLNERERGWQGMVTRHVNPTPGTRSPSGPILQLAQWIEDARRAGLPEPEAMTLATIGEDGAPSARVVLCRGIDERGLTFHTNYDSRKGKELAMHPQAAVVFLWAALGRQARVEGHVARLDPAESDAYFQRRPRGHQLSAWASPQSRAIASLQEVRHRYEEAARRFQGTEVPRPPFWGGFLLEPRVVELWTNGADRLHERMRYERSGEGWQESRLAP